MRNTKFKNVTRRSPFKYYVISTIILIIIAISFFIIFLSPKPRLEEHLVQEQGYDDNLNFNREQSQFQDDTITAKLPKIVHLDLKGAPFKIDYFNTLLPLLKKLGATGILIEYEDMFPYRRNISAYNAYSISDIKTINNLAKENDLEIIPLIQTFGHLEFILKLQEFKELREVPETPQVICPTHQKTVDLLMEMIEEVVLLHPNSKYFHIGADEVYYLGFCDRCSSVMSRFNLSKNMLFVEHINAITSKMHKKWPHLQVLMWDDEFRSFSLKELKNANLDLIQPIVWKYTKDVEEELGPSLWEMYSQIFPKMWIATAYKGATGSNQYVSDVTHYVQNHRSWLHLLSEHKSRINLQGVILTGWQRYDHFAVLCELLPVSLPSLAMSLRVLQGYKDSPLSPPTEIAKTLHCALPYALLGPAFGSPRCSFIGGDILENALRLQQIQQEFENMLEDSRVKGWLSYYNRKYLFSNPKYVQSATESLDRIKSEIDDIEREIATAMSEVYDEFTIKEWRETYIEPLSDQIRQLVSVRNEILDKDIWPRRPLSENNNNEL